MTDQTTRLELPLLHAGQAQKEGTHNEALTLLDLLLHGCVERVGEDTPPETPQPGECWIIGDAPTGAWAGRSGHFAGFTAGGWRFAAPREGMRLWSNASETTVTFRSGTWRIGDVRAASALVVGGRKVVGAVQPAIPSPGGGSNIDSEARSVLESVLEALRNHGLIAR